MGGDGSEAGRWTECSGVGVGYTSYQRDDRLVCFKIDNDHRLKTSMSQDLEDVSHRTLYVRKFYTRIPTSVSVYKSNMSVLQLILTTVLQIRTGSDDDGITVTRSKLLQQRTSATNAIRICRRNRDNSDEHTPRAFPTSDSLQFSDTEAISAP